MVLPTSCVNGHLNIFAGPPDFDVGLGLDDSIPQVRIPGMVPLALQKGAEKADVWPCLTVEDKSCGGEQPELRQAALC